MAYTRDQRDLFARMVGFFSRAGYNILDARIHTTRHGYALDSFIMLDVTGRDSDRSMINYIEHELKVRLIRQEPPERPAQGRISRQVKHFPIQPRVTIENDEKERNSSCPSAPPTVPGCSTPSPACWRPMEPVSTPPRS